MLQHRRKRRWVVEPIDVNKPWAHPTTWPPTDPRHELLVDALVASRMALKRSRPITHPPQEDRYP